MPALAFKLGDSSEFLDNFIEADQGSRLPEQTVNRMREEKEL